MTFFRIMLFLLPIIAIIGTFMFIRGKKKSDAGFSDADVKKLRLTILGVIVLLISLGVLLRFSDNSSPTQDATYIPPHMSDGELVPGSFEEKKPAEDSGDG